VLIKNEYKKIIIIKILNDLNHKKTNTYDRIVNKNPNSSVILSSIKGADKE